MSLVVRCNGSEARRWTSGASELPRHQDAPKTYQVGQFLPNRDTQNNPNVCSCALAQRKGCLFMFERNMSTPLQLLELDTTTRRLSIIAIGFVPPAPQEEAQMEQYMQQAAEGFCPDTWDVAREKDAWTLLLQYDSKPEAVRVYAGLTEIHSVMFPALASGLVN